MILPIYQVDAFAEKTFQGNPAAVCPLESWLPDSLMQQIAVENNLSETAFYVPDESGFHLRWFTPASEVELCGHATLATAYVLFELLEHGPDEIVFSSLSGKLKVVREGELLTLDFPSQSGEAVAVTDAVATALGRRPIELYHGADYMAIFEDEIAIRDLKPDMRLLSELDLRGVIATGPGNEVDFVSRFFAPKFGIDEDPVTGSAHCILTPYWAQRLSKPTLTARQISARGGSLLCRLEGNRVLISGRACLYMRGEITI